VNVFLEGGGKLLADASEAVFEIDTFLDAGAFLDTGAFLGVGVFFFGIFPKIRFVIFC
jgi:hypothetical protein